MSNDKVGLVLSGGGGKGAFQVGVIKAMAENLKYTGPGRDRNQYRRRFKRSGRGYGLFFNQSSPEHEKMWLSLAEQSPLQLSLPF
ncbi:MAG: hypothetical protein LBP22_04975 [Deltaproteobacteria bacterium]|jgi:hypothetical protein|nr:hypothetical protein [Deltaproteobacteria bacterium]